MQRRIGLDAAPTTDSRINDQLKMHSLID